MIWSGNGTKFVGAELELRENIEKWNTNNIAAELAHKGFEWKFKPPPVRPINVASWRGQNVVLSGYSTPSLVLVASLTRF